MMSAHRYAPYTVPCLPIRLVPPITQTAMASSSKRFPASGEALATRAHRAFCLSLSKEFPSYTANVWGITASDSVKGYVAWGGPPPHPAIDGTVVPSAAGGSLMFTPDISIPALRAMHERFGQSIYGRYGFADAFNPNTGWVNPDVISINTGIILLSADLLRRLQLWKKITPLPLRLQERALC